MRQKLSSNLSGQATTRWFRTYRRNFTKSENLLKDKVGGLKESVKGLEKTAREIEERAETAEKKATEFEHKFLAGPTQELTDEVTKTTTDAFLHRPERTRENVYIDQVVQGGKVFDD